MPSHILSVLYTLEGEYPHLSRIDLAAYIQLAAARYLANAVGQVAAPGNINNEFLQDTCQLYRDQILEHLRIYHPYSLTQNLRPNISVH